MDTQGMSAVTTPLEGTSLMWAPADDRGAFRWTVDPETGEYYIDAAILYGRVDAARLKSLRMREARPTSFYLVEGRGVPTEQDIADMIEAQRTGFPGVPSAVTTVEGRTDNGTTFPLVAITDSGGAIIHSWRPKRHSGLSTGEWYANTAQLFRHLQVLEPAAPTQALADACGVPFTTAVRWVRECRNRDLLPKSSKQLGKQRGDAQ